MHSGGHKSGVSFNCLVIHFYNWILLKLEVNRNVLTGKGQKSCFQKERKIKGMEEEVEKEKDNNNNCLRGSCSTQCKDMLQGHRNQAGWNRCRNRQKSHGTSDRPMK